MYTETIHDLELENSLIESARYPLPQIGSTVVCSKIQQLVYYNNIDWLAIKFLFVSARVLFIIVKPIASVCPNEHYPVDEQSFPLSPLPLEMYLHTLSHQITLSTPLTLVTLSVLLRRKPLEML